MTTNENSAEVVLEPWDRLRELTDAGDGLGLQAILATLEPTETVRAMFRLDTGDQQHLVALLSPDLSVALAASPAAGGGPLSRVLCRRTDGRIFPDGSG